jgi:hypothetical protein
MPTSSSCRALEQVKVISYVSVSFCCGLDLTDSSDHQLIDEAENRKCNETFNISNDTSVGVVVTPLQNSCITFNNVSNFASL